MAPILVLYLYERLIVMKIKSTFYIILGCIITLQGCSSQKHLESSAPFQVEKATCQEWVGGREESGTGFRLQLPIVAATVDDVAFKEVFFRGTILEAQLEKDNEKMMVVCNYTSSKVERPDIIMHSDPKKEVGNQPPKLDKKRAKFPFELKPDEAVISYSEKGSNKLKYIKIAGIVDKPSRIYPSRPQN